MLPSALAYGRNRPRSLKELVSLVAIWQLSFGGVQLTTGTIEGVPSVVEPNCDRLRQPDGCLKLSDWAYCDQKALIFQFLDIDPAIGVTAVLNSSSGYSATFIIPTAEGASAAQARLDKEFNNASLFADYEKPSPYYPIIWSYGSLDGVYNLEELVEAGKVNTLLGEQLGVNMPLSFRTNGTTVQVKGDYDFWWSTITGYVEFCGGSIAFSTDEYCCRNPTPEDLEDREDLTDDAIQTLYNVTNISELPVLRGVSTGRCTAPLQDVLNVLPDLVGNSDLADVIDAQFSGCNGVSLNISLTMFVAKRSSFKCTRDGPNLAHTCEVISASSGVSWDDCCNACYDDPKCGLFDYSDKCTLMVSDKAKGEGPKCFNSSSSRPNILAGDRRLLPVELGTDYALYHMLAGAYCPKELVSAGSINTLYGHQLGEELPLTFKRANNGSVVMTVLSGHGIVVNVTTSLLLDKVYTSCRTVIYVISDEYYPPMPSDGPLAARIHMNGSDLCDSLIENTHMLHKMPIWEDECFNTIPNEEELRNSTFNQLAVYVGGDVATSTNPSRPPIDPLPPPTTPSMANPSPPPSPSSDNNTAILAVAVAVPVACLLLAGAGVALAYRMYTRKKRADHAKDIVKPAKSTLYEADNITEPPASKLVMLRTTPETTPSTTPLTSKDANQSASGSGQLTPERTLDSFGLASAASVGSDTSWMLTLDDIDFVTDANGKRTRLGKGGYGEVFLGKYTHSFVAVKCVPHGVSRADDLRHLSKEINMLKDCRNANVVQFYGGCLQDGDVMLVTEYMPLGDLYLLLHSNNAPLWSWYNRGKFVVLDICRGLAYLHARRIVHCDLKSPNILLGKNGVAKIGDFGMARMMLKDYVTKTTNGGSLAWAAPELLINSKITEKVDIYSFGIILWEVVTGEAPARGMLRDLRPGEDCPEEIVSIFEQCIAAEAEDRPSADELCTRLMAVLQTLSASNLSTAGSLGVSTASPHNQ